MKTHYETLGVNKNASKEEIKSAYRKLAVELHPDKNPGDEEKEKRFKEVSHAYDILKDENKKRQYDNELKYGAHGNFRSYGNGNDDIRSHFFREFRTRQNQSPSVRLSPNIEFTLKIKLKDALKGGKIPIKFTRKNLCETCNGTKRNKCSVCNGTGTVGGGRMCGDCMTLGYTGACKSCRGMGFSNEYVETAIKIPTKIKSGTKMKLGGYGNKVKKGESYINGDVILKIEYPLSTTYMDGDRLIEISILNQNIYGSFKVDISEILTQKNIKLNFLDLKTLDVNLNLENGEYIFEGEGFAGGDLILSPNISIGNKEFTQEEKNKLEEVKQIFLKLYE